MMRAHNVLLWIYDRCSNQSVKQRCVSGTRHACYIDIPVIVSIRIHTVQRKFPYNKGHGELVWISMAKRSTFVAAWPSFPEEVKKPLVAVDQSCFRISAHAVVVCSEAQNKNIWIHLSHIISHMSIISLIQWNWHLCNWTTVTWLGKGERTSFFHGEQ